MAGVLDAVKNDICENESKRDSLFVFVFFSPMPAFQSSFYTIDCEEKKLCNLQC